jgi:hypothetical protein
LPEITYAVAKIDRMKLPGLSGPTKLAPGQTRTVFLDGGNLFVERNGKREQLFPEACDIFFRRGVEGRVLFRYGSSDKVDALIDRRNNEDVVWRKTQ